MATKKEKTTNEMETLFTTDPKTVDALKKTLKKLQSDIAKIRDSIDNSEHEYNDAKINKVLSVIAQSTFCVLAYTTFTGAVVHENLDLGGLGLLWGVTAGNVLCAVIFDALRKASSNKLENCEDSLYRLIKKLEQKTAESDDVSKCIEDETRRINEETEAEAARLKKIKNRHKKFEEWQNDGII